MKHGILILALAASAGVFAEEWVSVGGGSVTTSPAGASSYTDSSQQIELEAPSPAGGNTLLSELAMQVDQMQQEIALLRGQLEQQQYLYDQLKEEQQQRYLDVDRRLSALVVTDKSIAVTAPVDAEVKSEAAAGAKEQYQEAMDFIKSKQFPEAQTKLSELVKQHPQDPLVPNALYWSAEVWLVQGEPEKALVDFAKVVSDHPEHSKAADATYKIGVTLDRQGKTEQAKQWLQKVIDNYSGKADTTVRLAKSYLEKI